MKKGDLLAGLVLVAFGAFVIHQALRLDYLNEYGPGPGFLPRWVGIGLVALASWLSLARVFGHQERRAAAEGAWRKAGRALGTWGGFVGAMALFKSLGFILSFALLTLFLVLVMDRRSPFAAFTVAVGGALGFYLVFVMALGVPLPVGPWGF